ncbi:MAG: hypothetical protein Q8R12_04265 [bacterium]|nr:hypothetical protein [bacterium]
MVKIIRPETFDASFIRLPRSIQRKAVKKIEIFQENPFYPTLRAEKINPPHLNLWTFRIDQAYRILFRFLDFENVLFILADHHKNIYRYHELR